MEGIEVFSYLIIITLFSTIITGIIMEDSSLVRTPFKYFVIYVCIHFTIFTKYKTSFEEITAMHKTEDSYYLIVSKGHLELTKELYDIHLSLGHDVIVEAEYHVVTKEGTYEVDKDSFEYYLNKKRIHIVSNLLGHKSIKFN
jgi:hypothetical protein